MMFDSFGNFVPLYFSLNFAFLLQLFPEAIAELENSENYYTNYKQLVWLFGWKKGNINLLKVITIWA